MSLVTLTGVTVLDNPAKFSDPFRFEISFECLGELKEDLEWKLVYVGSASSQEYDQELESILVGPVPIGVSKFIFETDPPDANKIPKDDLLGATVILLSCSYRDQMFLRVGYYVHTEYNDPALNENPPAVPQVDKIIRNIKTEEPRGTKFDIDWEGTGPKRTQQQSQQTDSKPTVSREPPTKRSRVEEEVDLDACREADEAGDDSDDDEDDDDDDDDDEDEDEDEDIEEVEYEVIDEEDTTTTTTTTTPSKT